jgi:hypothetical protein
VSAHFDQGYYQALEDTSQLLLAMGNEAKKPGPKEVLHSLAARIKQLVPRRSRQCPNCKDLISTDKTMCVACFTRIHHR